ncbi:MAG: radical SAM family heme chaperone HemW [Pirellulales bacterium]
MYGRKTSIVATLFGVEPLFKNKAPRSAYIHIPFCVHRCGYCNFSVVAGRRDLVEPLLDSLAVELSWLGTQREVDTLYFGGGTPTYLTPEQLGILAENVLLWHPLASGYEWTVEANPANLDSQRIDKLAELGVNRLSLGGQSFQARKLELLERDHQADHIRQAVRLAHQAGMQVSLDLIFAVPGETLEQWESDLEQALNLQPEHISTYGLTFERGTAYWSRQQRNELTPLSEELQRDMYLLAIDRLMAFGFEHYEVSNFALPGCRSRHNEAYWLADGYYAAGPGAARYVAGVRETNHRSTTTYLKRIQQGESPIAQREKLNTRERAHEKLIFGLRRLEGVQRQTFQKQCGMELDLVAGPAIARLVEMGMLTDDGQSVRLTRAGLLVSDAIWPELL